MIDPNKEGLSQKEILERVSEAHEACVHHLDGPDGEDRYSACIAEWNETQGK